MGVRRTAPAKLVVPDERRDNLRESARQFLYCANRAVEFCWSDDSHTECITANTTARGALYDDLHEETDLTAILIQEAIRRAVRAVNECVKQWEKTSESAGVHLVEYALRQTERHSLPKQRLTTSILELTAPVVVVASVPERAGQRDGETVHAEVDTEDC